MHPIRMMLICMLLALISAFFWSMPVFGHSATDNDAMIYDAVGRSIATGDGLLYRGSLPPVEPLYPLFVGAVYWIAGPSSDAVRVVQIVLFVLTMGLLLATARRLVSEKIALMSTIATSLFWGLASLPGAIIPTTLLTFLVVLLGYGTVRAFSESRWQWLVLVGGVCALLSLALTVFFPMIVVWGCVYMWVNRQDFSWRRIGVSFACAGGAFLVVMIPWLLYSASRTDYGVASRIGYTLHLKAEASRKAAEQPLGHMVGHVVGYYLAQWMWPGLDPYATRGAPVTETWFAEMERSGLDYQTIDRRMRDAAVALLREKPEGMIVMTALNFLNFNSPIIPRPEDLQNQVLSHPLFAAGGYVGVPGWAKGGIVLGIHALWWLGAIAVVSGMMHLFRSSRAQKSVIMLAAIVGYFQISFSVVHAIPRHALPLYPWYFLFATIGISIFWHRIIRSRNLLIAT